jgi:restriction system protein
MNWLTNLIFGNDEAVKQTSQQTQQTQHLRESLNFAKQQQKNRLSGNQAPTKQTVTPQDPKARHLRNTLAFAKQQQQQLRDKQNEHERWQRHYGALHIDELKKLSGTEFEDYLAELFKSQGYQVETTPATGNYGADLLLHKDQQRTAVQAKCYTGSVGVSAVQEALSGMVYYNCHSAWVVTTGNYTANAVELARQSKVRLLDSNELGKLILQMQNPTEN